MKKKLYILFGLSFAIFAMISCKSENVIDDHSKGLDHLVFEEVFYTGTWVESRGYIYDKDSYVKIHNPTNRVLYLDGLALVRSAFQSDDQLELTQDANFIETDINVGTMITFPGNGTQYPIRPGASVLITAAAVNHKQKHENPTEAGEMIDGMPNSIDFTKADFEWCTTNEIKNDYYFNENTNVPNMIPVYADQEFVDNYGTSFHLRNNGMVALVKLGVSVAELKKKEYEWNWVSNKTSGGSHTHTRNGTCLKLPNDWVIDAVNICPKRGYKWAIANREKIDAGYNAVQEQGGSSNAQQKLWAGQSLQRRHDGRSFVDTNNSTVDFEVKRATLLTSNPKK